MIKFVGYLFSIEIDRDVGAITGDLHDPPRANTPPPRHLPQAELQNNPPRRLRRYAERCAGGVLQGRKG